MQIILSILYIIIGLIALLLIIALFTKKKYAVQCEIVVDKPKQDVFNYIRYLKNQDHYSKWIQTDPNLKKTFTGTDGTVGFIYAWEGNKQAGKGEQEIKKITEGEKVDIELRFVKPFAGIASSVITTEALSENQTRLTWGMASETKYPFNIMLLIMEGVLRKDIQSSLIQLKNILEKK